MEKFKELWVNLALLLLVLVLLVYVTNLGWKSTHFTNFVLVFSTLAVASAVIILLIGKPKSNVKEIAIEERYGANHAHLLISLHYRKNAEGTALNTVIHDIDFVNRSIPTMQELRISTINLVSMKLIAFVEKKYYLTDKFHHYFDESIEMDNSPFKRAQTVHALLNSLKLETTPQENIKIDFFTHEEYDNAVRKHTSTIQDLIDEREQ